jgi:hypothetical protein
MAVVPLTLGIDLRVALVDTSGNPIGVSGNALFTSASGSGTTNVQGVQAAGAAITENPVLIAGQFSGNVKLLALDTIGQPTVNQGTAGAGGASGWFAQGQVAAGAAAAGNPVHIGMYDGANIQYARSNIDVILLASASRTTTQTSIDQFAYNCRGVVVTFDTTAVGTSSNTLTINYKDPASGKYILLLSGLAVTANSTLRYIVHPEMLDKANVTAQDLLGKTFQIVLSAGNANPSTYSIGYTLII